MRLSKTTVVFLLCLLGSSKLIAQSPEEEIILTDTVERVGADTLTMEAPTVSIEEDTLPRFDAMIAVPKIPVRTIPGQKINDLKSSEEYWYANTERPKKKELSIDTGKQPLKKSFVQNLLWILILVSFLGVVVWYLVSSNILLFRKGAKKIEGDREEEETEDIFSLHFEKEISKAEEAGNYRLAVRLWYLQLLKELSARQLIDYRLGRTNSYYVGQLAATDFYKSFFRITRQFEYVWYGQFPLSAENYQLMRTDFVQFKKGLST